MLFQLIQDQQITDRLFAEKCQVIFSVYIYNKFINIILERAIFIQCHIYISIIGDLLK
jgi:hypothetical protein